MKQFKLSDLDREYIVNGLRLFNEGKVERDMHTPLEIAEYDDNGKIIAGLIGGTYWRWMYIDTLWVDESYRKKGIGTKLLRDAELEAIKRGCHHVHVDTMSWQAPMFYEKNGFKIISELNDIPYGEKKYHLIKELKH